MALTDNLVSMWKMNEASGDAVDSHGSNTLTETSAAGVGGIASAAGKIGNCRDFELGDTEYFTIADNASLSITGAMTICLWLNAESWTSNPSCIISKGVGGNWGYRLTAAQTTGQITFTISKLGSIQAPVTATTFGNLALATWYFVCARYDFTNDLIRVGVNLTDNTAAYTLDGIFDSTYAFEIGAAAAGFNHYDGLIDEVAIWSRHLSDAELVTLYNSGNGLAYPWASGARRRLLLGAA